MPTENAVKVAIPYGVEFISVVAGGPNGPPFEMMEWPQSEA